MAQILKSTQQSDLYMFYMCCMSGCDFYMVRVLGLATGVELNIKLN